MSLAWYHPMHTTHREISTQYIEKLHCRLHVRRCHFGAMYVLYIVATYVCACVRV